MAIERIDWWQVFADLNRRGYSVARIAAEIEIPRTRMDGWKNIPGTRPRFEDGMALARLWCDVLNLPLDSLPRE